MRLLLAVTWLLWATACDPALNMSGPKQTKRTTEGCPEAVARLRECCPEYESYLSCTVLESWEGMSSADLSERQSRCLRKSPCDAIEKAVTSEKGLCGVEFRGHLCRQRN